MKIINLVKKDLKLFKRDKKTLVLTILVPILLVFILGNIFDQSSESKALSGLEIGMCTLDKEIKDFPQVNFKIRELKDNCEEEAINLVSQGRLKATIVIPKNFSKNIKEGYGSELKLYVDNSQVQTALVASDSIKAVVQDLNEKIGTEFIKNSWENLKELNKNLKVLVSNLEIAKDQAIKIQEKTNQVGNNLNKINLTEIENKINTINQERQNLRTNSTLQVTRIRGLYNLSCSRFNITICNSLNETLTSLENLVTPTEIEENITKFMNNTGEINAIKKTKEEINKELKKINESIMNYTANIIKITDQLNKTTEILDLYTSRDPKGIVRAVAFNEKKVFGEKKYFEFLAPGIILIILLFTLVLACASNLVGEKRTGTLARTLLSPTSIPMFLGGKIIFFLIIAIIELLCMGLTLLLFNISITLNLESILILGITTIDIILIGMIMGGLAESENTALLGSLVVTLPMFFLSNLFFPFETMPNIMKTIGSHLPLTLSIKGVNQIMTYSSAVEFSIIKELIIIGTLSAILSYILIKRNPKID